MQWLDDWMPSSVASCARFGCAMELLHRQRCDAIYRHPIPLSKISGAGLHNAACPRMFPGVGTYANKHRKVLFIPPYKAEVLAVGYTVVSTVSVWLTQGTRR